VDGSEVAVAISTKDRPDALGRCLAAVWRGSVRPGEIVVVDQSRDDLTERIVRAEIASGMPVRYERAEPRGLGASQNIAFSRATAPIVAVTDDDCIVDERWLEVITRTMSTEPTLDAIAGRVLALPAEGERSWPVSLRTSAVRAEFAGYAPPWNVGSGNNFAMRRHAFTRIGGCDERLGPGSPAEGGVDMDLFYRLLRAGGRIRYEPDAVVHHERQRYAERLARRPMYGRGMGTCVALRMRDGDAMSARLLVDWIALRVRMLVRAALHADVRALREELTMLRSTLGGLAHGLLASARPIERLAPRAAP
jgi:glycosyltransferase involved in cell wall biosynthesis